MKKQRIYNSYEEINRDLAIYKLEQEIYLTKMKNDVSHIQDGLKPKNLVAGFLGVRSDGGGNWFSRTALALLPWTARTVWKMFR